MFRLAMCNDFLELKKRHPGYANPEEYSWGLKEFGRLFVLDQIVQRKPLRVLEVGAGLNPFFYKHFAHHLEYWMIDSGDLYSNPDEFRKEMSIWKNANYVDALLGDFSPHLPDNYFDLVFSISVLEHTPKYPPDMVEKVCKDMHRVMKPGGYTCHTIDITPVNKITGRFREAFEKSAFVFSEEPEDLSWDVGNPENQILLESISTVYRLYYRKFHEVNKPVRIFHFGSVMVLTQKTGENTK